MDLKIIFKTQMQRYPLMEPQDAVKLVYQNEFGGGHIIEDAQASLGYLTEEFGRVAYDAALPFEEDIGNGLARLNLGGIRPGAIAAGTVNNLFVASANRVKGSLSSFKEKLSALREIAKQNVFGFSADALDRYLEDYAEQGYPMLRHSSAYRQAYRPAYRVVLKKYIRYLELFQSIDDLFEHKKSIILAIDGPCGSGKTTLAGILGEVYGANIVKMDDFFLPPALRTEKRLSEPGGNSHYERFLKQVVPGLKANEAFSYDVFDCSVMDFSGEKHVEPGRVTVVEGSYSMHPKYGDIYDLKVFTTCSQQEQKRRILNRSGQALYRRFVEEWIPMENRYFDEFAVQNGCDRVIDTRED